VGAQGVTIVRQAASAAFREEIHPHTLQTVRCTRSPRNLPRGPQMPPDDLTSQGTQVASDDAQRKMWFEYLTKLNDRELQSARASGITPWALFAVAMAIIYKSVPQIPGFIATPGALKASLVVLILEIDAFVYSATAVVGLTYYCAASVRAHLLTEPSRRAAQIRLWGLRVALFAVTTVHFISPLWVTSSFVRWTLAGLGLFWLFGLISGIAKDLGKAREAKKHKLPVPAFDVPKIGPDLGAMLLAGMTAPVAGIAFAALLVFLHSLGAAPVPWVVALGTATQSLAVIVVLIALFLRGIKEVSRNVYLTLERDIILENLTATEIKARFIREALGPSVGDWVEMLNQKRRAALEGIAELADSVKPQLQEIEAIDVRFPIERAGRAKKVLEEFDKRIATHFDELKGIVFQLRQVSETSPSAWETGILTQMAEEWTAQKDRFTGAASRAGEVRKSLAALANPPQ